MAARGCTFATVMKKLGSTSDFTEARNKELLGAVRRLVMDPSCKSMTEVYARAVMEPCSRFWVSERRAAEVISKMLRGEDQDWKSVPLRSKMYRELCRRVTAWREENPCHHLSDAVFAAVNSQAPEFYLTPESAMVIVSRIMKRNAERHRAESKENHNH